MNLKLYETKYGNLYHLSNDTCIGISLEKYGEWAEEEISLLKNYVSEGDVIVDIGANIGTHSLAFSRMVGEAGLVISVEAQQSIFQILAVNMAINGVTNVVPLHALVGTLNEVGYFKNARNDESKNYGAVSFVGRQRQDVGKGSIFSVPIPKTSLDKLSLTRCDVIKIDVEGMEYEVLISAKETIKRHKPIIYFEAYMTPVYSKIITLLKEMEYKMYWHIAPAFNEKNYYHCSDNIFGTSGDRNILALHKSRASKVYPGPEVTSTEYPDNAKMFANPQELFCVESEEEYEKRSIEVRRKSDAMMQELFSLEAKFKNLLADRIKAQEIIEYLSKK